MKQSPFLSLIIPCYKQEKTIVSNLKQVISALDKTRYTYEVIVVVDGKFDKSFQLLSKAKLKPKKNKLIQVVAYEYDENRGKSYAIRFGMSKAKGEHVMFLDSGMEINPDGISMLLEHMKWYSADIIVGSKRHPVSQVKYTFQRKVLSMGYFYFVKILFGVSVKDTQAGIKVFKKSVLEKTLPRLVEKRFAGDLEMLVVAKFLGFSRVYEAPIKLDYSFSNISTAADFQGVWKIFIDTLAIFYRFKILKYYHMAHIRFKPPEKVRKKILSRKQK